MREISLNLVLLGTIFGILSLPLMATIANNLNFVAMFSSDILAGSFIFLITFSPLISWMIFVEGWDFVARRT